MKAMIMAAGAGTRLLPLTTTIPKPMLPILGIPLIHYSVDLLKQHGITDIVANLHYLPEVIANYLTNNKKLDVNIKFSFEESLLGTAGGVKNNQSFLEEDTCIVISGDGFTDIDLSKLYDFHKQKKAIATIALKPMDDVSKFGVVVLDDNQKITAFQEKPKREEALSNLVNTGIYIFEPEIFNYIPKQKIFDFGKDVFPLLVRENLAFYGWKTNAYWSDIGSFETYKEAQFDLLNKVNSCVSDEDYWHQPNIIRGGQLFTGDGTEVKEDTSIYGKVIVGKNCSIGSGCILHNCVIMDNVKIGNDVFITDSIIGNNCLIRDKVVIHGNCVVADNNIIESQVELEKGVKINSCCSFWIGKEG